MRTPTPVLRSRDHHSMSSGPATTIVKGLVVLGVLVYGFTYFSASCKRVEQPPPLISDLDQLVGLLHEWEHKSDTSRSGVYARVATELQAAMQAQHKQQHAAAAAAAAPAPATLSGPLLADAEALRLITMAGGQCNAQPNTDLWGDVVAWGSQHKAASAAECCAACNAYNHAIARGGLEKGRNSTACNTWVFCGDRERCGAQYQECWLKHNQLKPPPEEAPKGHSGPSVPWTSGFIYSNPEWLLVPLQKQLVLTLVTDRIGPVKVQLLPELAPASVREIQRCVGLTLAKDQGCRGCRIYRSEANFLVQGVMMDAGCFVATPRHPNPQQKRVMERGLVCWAGGAGGPDWFVNLIDQSGFGDDHLCFGKISAENMVRVDSITKMALKPKAKPDEMTFLAQEIRFNLTLASS